MILQENITRIKKIMGILNEDVINPNDDTINNAITDLRGHFEESKTMTYQELKDLLGKYGIEVVTYDEFISEYPDEYLSDAPNLSQVQRSGGFFGMVNPVTGKIRIILYSETFKIPIGRLNDLIYIIKHENIHYIQSLRKPDKKSGEYYGDVEDLKAYFKNKDEIMAFANTVVENYIEFIKRMSINTPNNFETAKKGIDSYLKYDYLFNMIRNSVDDKTLNRYKKYIYLYLQQSFN